MKKSVVITGVSTGIGFAAARELIGRGYHVFGSVRREADGQRVRAELGEGFTPLLFDVTDTAALPAAVAVVRAAVGDNGLAGLVNNAGIAPSGPLMHTSLEEVRQAFEINVFGLLAVTQAFLPLLGASLQSKRPPGRVVNLSSISGGVAFPMITLYAMTKHAVEALSDGLRRELSIYGIEVSAIEPGSIKTPIWDKAATQVADTRFTDTDYAIAMAHMPTMVANELKHAKPMKVVTDAICHALESTKPKTRYPLVGLWHARKIIPNRLLDRMAIKACGLKR
ncbi:MAG: SDR family NAD(P)-dependent oxidoreductase [Halioglobus sp.]|nr:SDR family NAD(P)-dependent oxidoreductase [Halioglobus sp.]